MLMDRSKPALQGWSTEKIHSSAQSYYESLLADIGSAKKSIDLAVYIFTLDDIGNRFVEALGLAADRGVTIRLLVDGVGSSFSGERIAKALSPRGADVRIYHPLPWYLSNYRWSLKPGGVLAKLYHFVAALNRRDHRKLCVIDDNVAWCGSFNITKSHIANRIPWRDYAVRVTGAAVALLLKNFDGVWYDREHKVSLQDLRYCGSNTSVRMRRLKNRALVKRIRSARHRVWICNAYFAPSGAVIRAIKAARKRNVDVTVVVADRSDITFFPWLSATYYADLLRYGVSIFRYQAGMLHAKIMLVDQQCIVGSTNLNYRSFYHDLELDVVLSLPQTISHAEGLIEEDIRNSTPIQKSSLTIFRRGIGLGWVLRIVRYWM